MYINDSQPNTPDLGTDNRGVTHGLTLNFTFMNWSTSCQSTIESCIKFITVHEFGHVLGFAHEQNRPDTPMSCNQASGDNGDTTFGSWDLNSVMNYCNPVWNNGGQLSVTDVAGAQNYYGRGPRYTAAIAGNANPALL
jgi:hypothetical protein